MMWELRESYDRRTRRARRARRARQSAGAGKRLEIQGLRAVAVVVVVFNHLAQWPKAGFVGVDVFFVISGYLITGRLLRTAPTMSVRAYFGSFYRLRAQRILPAGLLVIGITVLASWFAFGSVRAHSTAIDGGWAAIFWANWHFAAESTNYFDMGAATSPLQHYWSLSVEEQFYVVWPVLVFLICMVAKWIGHHRVSRLGRDVACGAAAAILSAAAFVYGIHDSQINPARAYFSTFDRAWELGVGAILACLAPHLPKVRRQIGDVFAWGGLLVIAVAVFVTPSSHGFPVPWAGLAVAGSAVVIAAGSIADGPLEVIALTNRGSQFVGDISYSIYLTHFPLIVILGALMPGNHGYYYAAVLLATLGISTLSYYFVEEPARSPLTGIHPDLGAKGAIGIILVFSSFLAYGIRPQLPLYTTAQIAAMDKAQAQSTSKQATTTFASYIATASNGLTKQLTAAIEMTHTPQITNRTSKSQMFIDWEPCDEYRIPAPAVRASCTFSPKGTPDPAKVAVVIGDSIAISALPMIRAALVPQGWTVIGFAREQCSAADADEVPVGATNANPGCTADHGYYADLMRQTKPSLVILTSAPGAPLQLVHPGDASYTAGMEKTIATVRGRGRKVLVMSPNPGTGNLDTCLVAGAGPSSCVLQVGNDWYAQESDDRAAAKHSGATYLSTENWYCEYEECPAIVGSTQVTYDGEHVTPQYAQGLAPEFLAALQKRHLV